MELREVADGEYFTWLLEPVLHRRISSSGPQVLVECVASGEQFSTAGTQRVLPADAPVVSVVVQQPTLVPLYDAALKPARKKRNK